MSDEGNNTGTFFFQSGVFRQPRAIPRPKNGERPPTIELLRNHAASFMDFYYPQHAYINVHNRISLFLMDDDGSNVNILKDINELRDGATLLIAVTGPPESHPSLLNPHNVHVHSFKVPTFCDYCGEMLYGLIRQGLKCHGCSQNFHKRCADKVPNTCPQRKRKASRTGSVLKRSASSEYTEVTLLDTSSDSVHNTSHRGSISSLVFGRPGWIDRAVKEAESEGKTHEHTFAIHNYMQPTVCSHCRRLLLGVFRQGFRCKTCRLNAHKSCRKYMKSVACVPRSSVMAASDNDGNRLVTDGDSGTVTPDEDAPNIPLQRICMSVRQTAKNIVPDLLYADWVIYRKEGDTQATVRYWQLDTRDLRLLCSDHPNDRESSKHCTTIPLSKILSVEQATSGDDGDQPKHIFTVNVSNGDTHDVLLVGELASSVDTCSLFKYVNDASPPESVIGSHALAPKKVTLKDALVRALDDKRVQTLYNVLCNAHTPVGGAQMVQHETNAVDGPAVISTPAPSLSSSPAQGMLESSSTSALLDATSTTQAITDGSDKGDVSSSSSNPQVKFDEDISAEEDMQYRLEHSTMKERPSKEMSTMYQVFADEVLGSGQFGIVLAGEHRITGAKVAIKVIEKGSNQSSETNQQMKNEAKLLSSIEFPGVILLHSMFESDKRLLIVMERMDSDMLDMILSSPEGRLPERVGRFLIFQILAALRYLHSRSIAHCDLKPENCLLTGNPEFPQVKLCDFGFARIIGERKFRKTVVGTPAYLAPEVLNNKGYNLSLDCWSVGVVIYVTLSGTFPFNEGEEITDQINSAEFLFPNNPWGNVSAEAQHLIINLLTLLPRRRYTTAKSVNHKWFANKQLWEDLRELENKVDQRYITHEAEDDFWERGGDLELDRTTSNESGDELDPGSDRAGASTPAPSFSPKSSIYLVPSSMPV